MVDQILMMKEEMKTSILESQTKQNKLADEAKRDNVKNIQDVVS